MVFLLLILWRLPTEFFALVIFLWSGVSRHRTLFSISMIDVVMQHSKRKRCAVRKHVLDRNKLINDLSGGCMINSVEQFDHFAQKIIQVHLVGGMLH